MLSKITTFIIRFLATFFQFFIVALISKQNNSEVLAFYFLYIAVHHIGSYILNFGFERIAFISISKNQNNFISSVLEVFINYFDVLKKKLYFFALLLLINICLFNLSLIQCFLITLCSFLFSINLIASQSIVASSRTNIGVFFVRVFYLLIISLILSYYIFFDINIGKQTIIYTFLLSVLISIIACFIYIKFNYDTKNTQDSSIKIKLSYDQYKIQISNIIFQRLPILLLNIFFSDKVTIAAFSLIHSFASIRGTIVDILGAQLTPKFLNIYENNKNTFYLKEYFGKIQFFTVIINVIYGATILAFGNYILNFFNPDFTEYFNILVIYICGNIVLSFFGLSIFLNSNISIKNSNHIKNIIMSISSMIILCFILNKYFEIEGLVIGVLISQLLLSFLSIKNIWKLLS